MAYNMTYEEYVDELRKECLKDAYVKNHPEALEKEIKNSEHYLRSQYEKGLPADSYGFILCIE